MNMYYCRFQNTALALRQCVIAINDDEKLSADEVEAFNEIMNLSIELTEMLIQEEVPQDRSEFSNIEDFTSQFLEDNEGED